MPLTDKAKFYEYARENKRDLIPSGGTGSYFSVIADSHESILSDIMIYDFFSIKDIEEAFNLILGKSELKNIDQLLRVTAVVLLRNKPHEVGLRERLNTGTSNITETSEDFENTEQDAKNIKSPLITPNDRQPPESELQSTAPPQFFYPM